MALSIIRPLPACGLLALAILAAGCAQADRGQVFSAAYACEDGQRFTVRFEREAATVRLADGRSVTLTQRRTASGIHYANDGYDLRGKGDEATWTAPGQTALQCKSV